jgi:hypothetical protein
MQRSGPEHVSAIHIRATLYEYLSEFHVSSAQCEMQRSRFVMVLGIHIRAMLDEHVSDVKVPVL